jgi:heme-degrading monooxygenase HmoA
VKKITIDPDKYPDHQFRIDAFSVPEAARDEFEAAMNRNLAFLETVPGFLGHAVFEKADGPSTFNIVTIARWRVARRWKTQESRSGRTTRASGST